MTFFIFSLFSVWLIFLETSAHVMFIRSINYFITFLLSIARQKHFLALYYFPFFRYSKNNPKLGIRELLASLYRVNIFDKNKGYIGLQGNEPKEAIWQRELPKKIERNTTYNDSIKFYLDTNTKKSIFFTAPFRPDTKNLFFISQLKNELPVFWDFQNKLQILIYLKMATI